MLAKLVPFFFCFPEWALWMRFAVFVLQVCDFILEEEEMKTITALNRGWRYICPTIKVSLLHPVPKSNSYSCDWLS